MMKTYGLMRGICSGLLCLWYLASVVGFDVHVDHHDDKAYLVSLLGSLSCEDIHPEDDCSCCHHDGCDGDCEDITELLTVTGTGGDNHFEVPAPVMLSTMTVSTPLVQMAEQYSPLPDSCKGPPRPDLLKLCVLRV